MHPTPIRLTADDDLFARIAALEAQVAAQQGIIDDLHTRITPDKGLATLIADALERFNQDLPRRIAEIAQDPRWR